MKCDWSLDGSIYEHYHDTEWGVPTYDDTVLFEFLVLESAQAGLSWITILKKREGYKKLYNGFDPKVVSKYTEKDILKLLDDPSIVRNRKKIEASINNARCFLKVQKDFGTFAKYIWSFSKGKTIHGSYTSISEVPPSTPFSDNITKDLKKRGFKFLGNKTVYAYLQSIGVVNDHILSCPMYKKVKEMTD